MELFKKAEAELLRSNKDRKHPFRFAQLATFGNSFPELRTVVKRQMNQDWQFLFYTDQRTAKVAEIRKNAAVSLHFYDTKKQLQLRIRGKAKIIESGSLFEEHLSRAKAAPSVKDYCSILPPSKPLEGALDYGEQMYFALLLIETEEVDVLQLSRSGHQRLLAERRAGEWSLTDLVP
jgi:hypothetical protein